jgi:hypothetical protein
MTKLLNVPKTPKRECHFIGPQLMAGMKVNGFSR